MMLPKIFSPTVLLILALFCFSTTGCKNSPDYGESVEVEITTDKGVITLFLFNETPLHKQNLIEKANSHYYDSMLFHRVIKGFVIQTGDPASKEAVPGALYGESPSPNIPAEIKADFHHIRGVVGAAREGDEVNPEKASSGSHFYIVQGYGDPVTDSMLNEAEKRLGKVIEPRFVKHYKEEGGSPRLDGNYTIFGYVVSGMDVVDAIAEMETDDNDRPKEDVRILSMKVINLDKKQTKKYYDNYAK